MKNRIRQVVEATPHSAPEKQKPKPKRADEFITLELQPTHPRLAEIVALLDTTVVVEKEKRKKQRSRSDKNAWKRKQNAD